MRRLAATVLAMLTALSLDAAGAHAAAASSLNREVSGPVAGSAVFDLVTPGCPLVHQVVDGTYTTANGHVGSVHADVCPIFGLGQGTVDSGNFTIRDSRGSTVTGTVTGTYDTSRVTTIPFAFTLHVTTGTKRFRNARGTIAFTGVWQLEANPGPVVGTLLGSLER